MPTLYMLRRGYGNAHMDYRGWRRCGAHALGYLTAAAQPAFTIIYASGYLKQKDFFKIGWKMMFVSFFLLLFLAGFYWPLIADR